MDTKALEKFAQAARRQLHEQVDAKLERVLRTDSAELRGSADALKQLKQQLKDSSRAAVVERVAYTWFNRFCALRFMDANQYTRLGVVSPATGFTQPEILQEAKQGHIDPDLERFVDAAAIFGLLEGRLPSPDPQQEAYRRLLVGACNQYHAAMPLVFEPIADYTELLLPDDLLSAGSILQAVREALTPDACQGEEVVGWLYQFYISEKKDAVDVKVKAGGKVEADELPAKTALYTPHWIVRFLVENSLGRLWLLNRPQSKLAERMEYYIAPEQSEVDFLHVNSPEELRVGDDAVGSGHMLLYAFELLYAIYEEEGYNAPDIARLILEKNLYGMEIDERSASLAAFALTMKARRKDRRFMQRNVCPNICVLHSVHFTEQELTNITWLRNLGNNLLDLPVRDALLHDLRAAALLDNVGSLLRPQLMSAQIERVRTSIDAADNLFTHGLNERVLDVLVQMEYLSRHHHVVVTNPPYLGKGMNDELSAFARDEYPDSKSDMFAMFIERGLELVLTNGFNAMVTMESWMFLSSYEKLRTSLLATTTIHAMVHMPYLGKGGTSMGINFGTVATIFQKAANPDFKGHYSCVRYYETDENGVPFEFPIHNERLARASVADFRKIPGAPIAYWVSDYERDLYATGELLGYVSDPRKGMDTGENEHFLRRWYEIDRKDSSYHGHNAPVRWYPYNKGGEFRRWYGNREYVVNWKDDGKEIKSRLSWDKKKPTIRNEHHYFEEGFTWTTVSSSSFSARYSPPGALFDNGGCTLFAGTRLNVLGALLNSKVASRYLEFLSPTLNFQAGDVARILCLRAVLNLTANPLPLIESSRVDWDSYETSWDFADLPLLRAKHRRATLAETYASLCSQWQDITIKMQRLEEDNNRIFIEAYGLKNEIMPDVPLHEITLTCNPHYRYGAGKSDAEYETLLLADTMREFISYAVGCMFGRYSLDKPGLILANQGETVEDYLRQVPEPTFAPDRDNVIPILDGDWFTDDIVERFKRFLRVSFGDEHYSDNLAFIEKALGRDLRNYFVREFYDVHVKRYQKRPIYWLFSSPKGSFNALVYMHRYRPDTVSVVLNDYLREFRTKLTARKTHLEQVSISLSVPPRDKTAALKEIDRLAKVIAELAAYEKDVLYPLATQQVRIDLDEGVKVNYKKFGPALKRVTGLSE